MDNKASIAKETAKMLLEVEAISISTDKPFQHTSGRYAPVYVDCRKLIAFPRIRRKLIQFAGEVIEQNVGYEALDVVAGGETAGIPYAAWLAEYFNLPMLYVRKKAKGFGKQARIEGAFQEGQRGILIEDLATDGGSKINFCLAMREAGLKVHHSFVVFYYDSFPDTAKQLKDADLQLHYLTTWNDVLNLCAETGQLNADQIKSVQAFLADPVAWDENYRKIAGIN